MSTEITECRDKTRFELRSQNGTAALDYIERGNVWRLTHTYVPSELRGQGIAARLVKHVLDAARTRGKKVVPECSYVDAYVSRHSEYQDLVANV